MSYTADPSIVDATISAVIYRADGTVEDLGIISRFPVEKKGLRALVRRAKKGLK